MSRTFRLPFFACPGGNSRAVDCPVLVRAHGSRAAEIEQGAVTGQEGGAAVEAASDSVAVGVRAVLRIVY